MNNIKTVGLLSLMSALVWWLGLVLFGGVQGMVIGLLLAVGLNFFAYFFSAKMALTMSRARPVAEHELPNVYGMVRRLAASSDMPMPSIHLMDSPQPNAFATGRNPKHAALAVTTGILQIMRDDELEGVLAHELSHVRNRDILISSIAAMLAAALTIFSRIAFWFGGGGRDRNNPAGLVIAIAAMILAPIAGMIIKMAISRAREYQADRSGAEMTGQPLSLARALDKIGTAGGRIPMEVNPAVSQLFIADPLKAFGRRGGGRGGLFSTHPPIEERIRRLEEMYYRT